MKGNVHRSDGARRDLIAIYRLLAREAGRRTADRFLKATEATFLRLAAMPGLGTRYELETAILGELRVLPLASRFKNYLVFYHPVADGVQIVRVLHGARDIPSILSGEFGPDDDDNDDAADD